MSASRPMMPTGKPQISNFRFAISLPALAGPFAKLRARSDESKIQPYFGIVAILLAVLVAPGCATIKLNMQASGLMMAYGDIKKGRFDDAMDEVEQVEKRANVPPEVRSEAAYVKALVLEGQKKLPEAIAQYREVVATYPNTPDGYLSRKRLKELETGTAGAR